MTPEFSSPKYTFCKLSIGHCLNLHLLPLFVVLAPNEHKFQIDVAILSIFTMDLNPPFKTYYHSQHDLNMFAMGLYTNI